MDLNLLKSLRALLEERSVSRAAERLGVSQPAASAALAKLRRHFNDELLIRAGNGHRLTPLAAQLKERVVAAVTTADRVFSLQPDFAPASSHREFTLTLSDYSTRILGQALSQLLTERAPYTRLHLRQLTAEVVDHAPESLRDTDALLLPHGFLSDLPYQDLLQDDWTCLIARGNTEVGGTLTTEHLARLPWVFTYHQPTAFTTAVRELRIHGIEPHVQIVTENYSTLPPLVAGTERVALIQRRLALQLADPGSFRVLPSPVPLAPLALAAWWHPANTADAGHQWLRRLLLDAARAVDAQDHDAIRPVP
jgi:DNA-binding transcriptional LysR family regulator